MVVCYPFKNISPVVVIHRWHTYVGSGIRKHLPFLVYISTIYNSIKNVLPESRVYTCCFFFSQHPRCTFPKDIVPVTSLHTSRQSIIHTRCATIHVTLIPASIRHICIHIYIYNIKTDVCVYTLESTLKYAVTFTLYV
jgi:hypothetical protein